MGAPPTLPTSIAPNILLWYTCIVNESGTRRAVKVRLYPTPEQESLFSRTAGSCRFVYNLGLGLKNDVWDQDQLNISTVDLIVMLPLWKEEFPWLAEVPAVALQQSLRNLDRAYQNFFTTCKGEGKSRFPRFKTRNSRTSFRLVGTAFSVRDGQLTLAKAGSVIHHDNRPLPANASSVTVSRDAAGRWYASLLIDDVIEAPITTGTKAIGIDLGIKTLAATSDGEEFENPKHFARRAARLARYQRQMAKRRPKPGQAASRNYLKAKAKAGRTHARIADARRDNLHKVTSDLVARYDIICIEDLNVAGLIKSKRMSRSICDAAWGEFRELLNYKTQWYGKRLVVIDRFSPTSKTCSACEEIKPKLMLSEREWTCTGCGTLHDRDLNAAKNILAAGLAVLGREAQEACGEDVRPKKKPRASSHKGRQSSVKQETTSNTRVKRVSAA
jgi:putative transposase